MNLPPGFQLIESGDRGIDMTRPRIENPDGSFSTERTIGIEADGRYFNIPTIVNGRQLSEEDAIRAWERGENKEVGVYGSQAEADAAAPRRSDQIGHVRGAQGTTPAALPPGFSLIDEPRQEQQPKTEPYRGGILPFSKDDQGNVSFDSDAGIVGSIKRTLSLGRDIAEGRVPVRDEDGNLSGDLIERSFEVATVATPATAGRALATAPKVAGPPPVSPLIQASERLGVDMPRAAASENMSVQRAGQALATVPVVGNPIKAASGRAIEQIGDAATRTAEGFGRAGVPTAQGAGATAREGIETYIGPALSARVQRAYDAVDKFVPTDAKAPLTATAQRTAQIAAEREAAGLPPSAASAIVQEAAGRDGLTYQGVKKLRTRVGEMLKGGPLPGDMSQGELKAIYGSLSDDLRGVVQSAGGERGLAAFNRANKYNSLVADRRENLARLLKAPSEEGVLDKILASASSSSRSDVTLLSQARKALPADEWGDLASAAVGRLGQSRRTGEFSADQFVSDYARLSPQGKAILFNSTGKKDLARALDDIATVSGRFKELQKFANPSGTAQNVIGVGSGAALMAEPVTTITGLLGGAVVARVLASPATAKSMAQWSRAYEAAVRRPGRAAASGLRSASRRFAQIIANELALQPYMPQIARALEGAAEQGSGEVTPEPRPAGR